MVEQSLRSQQDFLRKVCSRWGAAEEASDQLGPRLERIESRLAEGAMLSGSTGTNQDSPAPLLSSFIESLFAEKEKRGAWGATMVRQAHIAIRLFLEIAGDKPLASYTRADMVGFRDTLERLPNTHGKSSTWRNLSVAAVIKRTDRDTPDAPRLSLKTLRRHWALASALLEWASANTPKKDQRLDREILNKHTWSKSVVQPKGRGMWNAAALTTPFSSPLYVGCAGLKRSERWRAGPHVFRDAYFWLSLLALFTGAREEELARLRVVDVDQCEGVWIIDITDAGVSGLKGSSAPRKIPVHKDLVKLGFLAHVRQMAARGETQLFPELLVLAVNGRLGTEFGEFFTDYRKHIGIYVKLMDFHSLRTTFTTEMIRLDVPILIVDEVTGHDSAQRKEVKALQSMSVSNYYDGATLRRLKKAVDKFKPGVDLSHLYVA
jgi:integrase